MYNIGRCKTDIIFWYFACDFQNEGGEYDTQDVKTMLHSLGLVGKMPTDVLMNIHAEIKKEMRGILNKGLKMGGGGNKKQNKT